MTTPHWVRDGLRKEAVTFLALPKGLLGSFLLGHFHVDAEDSVDGVAIPNRSDNVVEVVLFTPYRQFHVPCHPFPSERSSILFEPAGKDSFIRTDVFGCLAESVPVILPGHGVLQNATPIGGQGKQVERKALHGSGEHGLALRQFLLNSPMFKIRVLQYLDPFAKLDELVDKLFPGLALISHGQRFLWIQHGATL